MTRLPRLRRVLRRIAPQVAVGAVALGIGLQLVPYGRDHGNPPVRQEPAWDSPRTRELAVAACFDCHSNETEWPWYSNVAPMSWLVQRDVDDGRAALNFSELDVEQDEAEDAAETVLDREMPPRRYLPLHPGARLDAEERQALADGLAATFGDDGDNSGPGSGGDEDNGEDDGDGSGPGSGGGGGDNSGPGSGG